MNIPELRYNPSIQPENRQRIADILESYKWLIPHWVLYVDVNLWDSVPENDGEMASVTVNYDYRNICLSLCTAWLDRNAKEREEAIVHELLHGYLGIIADYARDIFDRVVAKEENPNFNATLQDGLRVRHESATQDLMRAILAK